MMEEEELVDIESDLNTIDCSLLANLPFVFQNLHIAFLKMLLLYTVNHHFALIWVNLS